MDVINATSEEGSWTSFVQSVTSATHYHQFGWSRVIARSYGHRCHYLAAVDARGMWQGALPLVHIRSRAFGNTLVSMPFVNYGGVISVGDEPARALIDSAERLRKSLRANRVELRHLAHRIEGLPTQQHKVTMVLDLRNDAEAQWSGFNAKLRNQIRKAEKVGLRAEVGHLELLDGFYEVFARNMRDLGSPVHGRRFFETILKEFRESTRVIAIYHEDKIIASAIALTFRRTMEIPWASSISDYNALCPNLMLYWKAISLAIGEGCTRFDFGRSTPNGGTYNFKKQWGAAPIPLHWQYLADEGTEASDSDTPSAKYEAAVRLWQRLPVSLTKVLGPRIRRSISL